MLSRAEVHALSRYAEQFIGDVSPGTFVVDDIDTYVRVPAWRVLNMQRTIQIQADYMDALQDRIDVMEARLQALQAAGQVIHA